MGVIFIEHYVRTKGQLVKNRGFTLVQQMVRLFVITLSNPLLDGSFISKIKKLFQIEISFHFLIILQCEYIEKHETL